MERPVNSPTKTAHRQHGLAIPAGLATCRARQACAPLPVRRPTSRASPLVHKAIECLARDVLLRDEEALSTAVRNGISALENSSELEHSRRGGQYRDSRLDTFVMYLAHIFRRYKKSESKFTIDTEKGQPIDAFSRYLDEAIIQFHPEGDVPPGSLRNALQQNRQFLRDTEYVSGEALDRLVPEDPLVPRD